MSSKPKTTESVMEVKNLLNNSSISTVNNDKIGDKQVYKISYKNDSNKLSKCHYCHSIIPLATCAIGLPIRIKKEDHRDKFIVEGSFCSWNCILSYIDQQSSVKYRECKIYLNLLYKQLYKNLNTNSYTNFYDIKPSKDWRLLTIYGGELTQKDWKQDNFIQLDNKENKDIIDKYNECVIQSEQILFD
jgi:hypothetical protein